MYRVVNNNKTDTFNSLYSPWVNQNPWTSQQNQSFLSRGNFLWQYPTPSLAEVAAVVVFCTQGCLPMPMRLWWGPELVFSLSVCPLRRKCASSLKRRTSKRGGCSRSVCWYSGRVYSLGSCWPGFEPRESALCMETVSGRYEGLSSYNSWKSPLHVTTVWWTFVVTVPNESSSPEGLLMFWQSNVHHCGSCCWLPHCQSLWTSVSGFGWCCNVGVSPWEFATELPLDNIFEKFKDSGPLLNTKLFLRVHLGVRWNLHLQSMSRLEIKAKY